MEGATFINICQSQQLKTPKHYNLQRNSFMRILYWADSQMAKKHSSHQATEGEKLIRCFLSFSYYNSEVTVSNFVKNMFRKESLTKFQAFSFQPFLQFLTVFRDTNQITKCRYLFSTSLIYVCFVLLSRKNVKKLLRNSEC